MSIIDRNQCFTFVNRKSDEPTMSTFPVDFETIFVPMLNMLIGIATKGALQNPRWCVSIAAALVYLGLQKFRPATLAMLFIQGLVRFYSTPLPYHFDIAFAEIEPLALAPRLFVYIVQFRFQCAGIRNSYAKSQKQFDAVSRLQHTQTFPRVFADADLAKSAFSLNQIDKGT
jgi:hypothetical protein